MTSTNIGNIGIGTANPECLLHMAGEDSKELFRVTLEGEVTLGDDISIKDLQHLDSRYLRLLSALATKAAGLNDEEFAKL